MSTNAPGYNVGVAGKGMNSQKETIGKPDGPPLFVPEFGMEVGTFTNPRLDMYKKRDPSKKSLMHHVPFEKRGYYKPDQVADYDPEEFEYIVDDKGYAVCTMGKNDGSACPNRAMHMSWKCATHGGKLHPLDKVPSDERAMMPTAKENGTKSYVNPDIVDRMTRYQKLLNGIISVEDLDDEELARGQCRASNGSFHNNPPRMMPKSIHDAMVQQLFVRANAQLRQDLMGAVKSLGQIASGEIYEPQDRIKAAGMIIDRVMGKNADVVIHTQDKPWELALTAISGGSRAESRKARGLDPETGMPIIDAEIAEVPDDEVPDPDYNRDDIGPGDGDYLGQDEQDWPDPEEGPGHVDLSGSGDSDPDVHGLDERGDPGVVEEAYPGERNEQTKESKTALRERLKAARRQRYASREAGSETLVGTPYRIMELGENPEGEGFNIRLKKMVTPRERRTSEWNDR